MTFCRLHFEHTFGHLRQLPVFFPFLRRWHLQSKSLNRLVCLHRPIQVSISQFCHQS